MKEKLRHFTSGKYTIFLVLIVFVIIASILNENFLAPNNVTNILRQVSVITIMALGAMGLIIGGMIDLSAGSVMAFSGVVAVMVYKATGSMLLAILVGIAVGAACNLVSAFFVATFDTPAFIVTLGMMMVARGAVLQITSGQNLLQLGDYVKLGQGSLGSIPLPAIFLVIAAIIVWYLMSQTRFGRGLYAVGGNMEAARASGISVPKVQYQVFLMNGVLVGFAGVLFMSRVNAGLPNAGVGYELQAIMAPIIGGTSFSGGIGTTTGTIAGALIVGILNNIMNLMGVSSYIQQIVMGTIIAVAVTYDVWSKNKKSTRHILVENSDETAAGDTAAGSPQPRKSLMNHIRK